MELVNDKLIVCKTCRFQLKAHYKEDIENVVSLSGAGGPIATKSLTIMVPQINTQNISKKLLSNNTDKLKWLHPFLIQRWEGVR